ncbi:hypothetical protein L1987_30330 [Smallanthus sonchifolius]|uniref:Uncharacterized protein n=1 Tax=Smallanthus sonchifolius TaxID=185202 RepID=A0ACB9I2H3_9ASTR|nr:hypothetical protein L1987_30330 [Smallanthus sonchifolius]
MLDRTVRSVVWSDTRGRSSRKREGDRRIVVIGGRTRAVDQSDLWSSMIGCVFSMIDKVKATDGISNRREYSIRFCVFGSRHKLSTMIIAVGSDLRLKVLAANIWGS